MSHETRIQSAKDKWANPGLAKRVVRMTAIFGGEHQKSGIDLLVEDHAHHENIPKYMIHPNNSIRRYVHIILVVLLSQDFDNPLTYFFLFSLSLSLSLSLSFQTFISPLLLSSSFSFSRFATDSQLHPPTTERGTSSPFFLSYTCVGKFHSLLVLNFGQVIKI